MNLEGFDLSAYQSIDWNVFTPRDFAFCKASEGVGFRDSTFDMTWDELGKRRATVRGAYHYGRPDLGNSPYAEVDWFLNVVGDPTGALLALNIEVAHGHGSWARDFIKGLDQRCGGYQAGVCTFQAWLQEDPVPADLGLESWFWFEWPDANGPMPSSASWRTVSFQQYGAGSVPGIAGQVDLNRFFGDPDHLRELTVGGNDMDPELRHALLENTTDPNGANPTLKDLVERIYNSLNQEGGDLAAIKASVQKLQDLAASGAGVVLGPGTPAAAELDQLARHLGLGVA